MLNTTFDRLVCNDDSDSANETTTSIVLRLSASSQREWGVAIASFERAMELAGVPVSRTRSQQEFFHTTIGVVDRALYPTDKAIAAVNQQFVGQWTGANEPPIVVDTLLMLGPPAVFRTMLP